MKFLLTITDTDGETLNAHMDSRAQAIDLMTMLRCCRYVRRVDVHERRGDELKLIKQIELPTVEK